MSTKKRKNIFEFNFKRFILLYFLFTFTQSCISTHHILADGLQLIDMKQFGFAPDGKTNNSTAFRSLSRWLNGKKNLKLVFPKGTYLIGKQEKGAQTYLQGRSMFVLRNCQNIIIDGNNATFKYIDNLKFGSFNPITGKKHVVKKGKKFTDRKYAAEIGNFIHIIESSDIKIQNVIANGNSDHMYVGGRWGDQGIQLNHTGIRVTDSRKIHLSHCMITHFGLDGIYIKNKTPKGKNTPSQRITLDHISSLYCGRQGLSWTGGSGLTITNSEFSYVAQGKVKSAPAAGIDFEPHRGLTCANASIKNCKFIKNATTGFLSDFLGQRHVYNINIDSCYFQADKGSAIFPRSGGITISNSQIVGPCIGLMGIEGNESKMINCYFTDSLFNHKKARYLPYFFNGDKASYYTVENCVFSMYRFLPIYISSRGKSPNSIPRLKSNTFILQYQKKPLKPWISVMRNVFLENNTFVDKTGPNNVSSMFVNTNINKVDKNIYRGINKIISRRQFGWRTSKGQKVIQSKN